MLTYTSLPIKSKEAFRCANGYFYVALGSSMGLALLVWVGGGLLKRVLYFFGNGPNLGLKSPILHQPPKMVHQLIFMQVRFMTTTCQHAAVLWEQL